MRLRQIGDSLRLTVKRGSGETREEIEIELGEDQFDALWPLTEGRRVAKRRYFVDQDELTFEADVYEGELEGMITVEVEFDSEGDSQAFEPPDWFGQEVTGDSAYSNESFALHGNPESEGNRRRHRGGGNGGRRRGRDPSRG